jgi:hypothetical protein
MRLCRPVAAAVTALGIASASAADAPAPERRVYQSRRSDAPPALDGRLDDVAWAGVDWSGDFVQRDPADGKPPTRQTQFKVVYDQDALYFAFRAFDDRDKVASLLARRDRFPGDWIEVNIDSYFDHRTAFSFTLSLSGTRGDEFISNDGNRWDANWDPVWEAATAVDDEGWTAEMRIPLSQLRFSSADKQTWGLQVTRRIFRQEERSTWQAIPKDVSGWVSRFGELRGIEGIRPRRRLEVLPYAVAKGERFEAEAGNPFRDGGSANLTGGLDAKLGLTSDLTADVTLNPDFGQVEADPSQVNLTAFETFFAEKRPFFIEGSDIFELRLAPAITGGHFTQDRLFYSRRIGGRPPHDPDLADGEHALSPGNTSILGAFKLSGKTARGLSVGVLESVTAGETAQIDTLGLRRREAVAPLTNYFVGRVQQDLRGGDTQLGVMLTALQRDLGAPNLDFLTGQAWAGGVDFFHYLGQRAYLVEANLLGSHLRGSPRAIEDVQTSSARYFQRPDRDHARLDASRTSLTGHAGSARLTRTASNSNVRFQTGAAWRSPGFEINDLGYMQRADEINQFGWAAYQLRNPFSVFRWMELNVNEWLDWDFSGRLLRKAANTNAHASFKNSSRLGGSLTREFEGLSNTELRGGPTSRWPGSWSYEAYAGTDTRRKVYGTAGVNGRRGDEGSERTREWWLDLAYRPTNALNLAVRPSYGRIRRELQYVDTVSAPAGERYLFGQLDQDTIALTFRADLSITPNLTIQYYGAPFASSGTFAALKRITDPRARAFSGRFRVFRPAEIAFDPAAGAYRVDEDADGRVDYSFDRPDFDFRDFNSTLVVRWEYRPGSQMYVVWSQARQDETLETRGLAFGRGMREIFRTHPHDVFLVKFSRWFSL